MSARIFAIGLFQSTRPHGARQNLGLGRDYERVFQSTRPHGARLHAETSIAFGAGFQSTRPHGARLRAGNLTFGVHVVSIHAPAWGATQLQQQRGHFGDVSIHAPAWGATLQKRYNLMPVQFQSTRPHGARPIRYRLTLPVIKFQSTRPHGARPSACPLPGAVSGFNPRARMGRDFQNTAGEGSHRVSIHAPAWGATIQSVCTAWRRIGFNPRARMGRDPVHRQRFSGRRRFNPRARMGRDYTPWRRCCRRSCFNPRARMGRDIHRALLCHLYSGFNPRARMGRDEGAVITVTCEKVSIHAPAWGATSCSCSTRRPISFNPRARMGRDLPSSVFRLDPLAFQSTRPHGARPNEPVDQV